MIEWRGAVSGKVDGLPDACGEHAPGARWVTSSGDTTASVTAIAVAAKAIAEAQHAAVLICRMPSVAWRTRVSSASTAALIASTASPAADRTSPAMCSAAA